MKIRRASLPDAEAIADLYIQLKNHHAGLSPDAARYAVPDSEWVRIAREGLSDGTDRFYVATRGPEIVGFGKLHFQQKPWGLACEVDAQSSTKARAVKGSGEP